ncbi:MAG TPA: division/cell wall cluster transcriptional repressor MraZ [Chitinispirillaceae bacterium]|nr:division/cell wall cluster transcriptional repressor MraZ [Chitinispirillaceae bacterium]
MGRFLGKFDYSVDSKGRVNIPAKFRKALRPEAGDVFVICRAPDGCIRAYPNDLWEHYEAEINSRPETKENSRLKRLIFNSVTDSTLDSQGRITLTPALLAIAGIKKEVVLVGQSRYIEIWEPTRYDEYLGAGEDFDEVFYKSVETMMGNK